MPYGVPDIQPRAALEKQPHHRLMATQDGLVQRRAVGMVAFWVVAVGVLAGVEQQTNNLRMSLLCSQGESAVTRFDVRGWDSTGSIAYEPQSGGGGQIDTRPAFGQSLGGVAHPEGKRGE